MRKVKKYFYDNNCNIVENDNAINHDEIAREVIQNNPELLAEYNKIRQSGIISESVFLVMKGYIYVGETDRYKSAMFSSISMNPDTRNILIDMKEEEDAYLYDIIQNELKEEQKNQIRKWAKEGMPRSEIINKVMTDMIVLLAPTKNSQRDSESDFDER